MLVVGAIIALLGVQLGQNTQANVTDAEDDIAQSPIAVDEDDDAVMGAADAPIVMIEFSDFQCPFCRKFYNETFEQIKENYIDKGLVKFVYRDMPLVSLGHTDSIPASNAAECAREQGGDEMFFQFHNKIFDGENKLGTGTVAIPEDDLYTYAQELDLDMDEFTSCQENLDFEDEIQADFEAGRAAGINGTPAFVINGQVITGAYPYETFESLFEQILNQ